MIGFARQKGMVGTTFSDILSKPIPTSEINHDATPAQCLDYRNGRLTYVPYFTYGPGYRQVPLVWLKSCQGLDIYVMYVLTTQ